MASMLRLLLRAVYGKKTKHNRCGASGRGPRRARAGLSVAEGGAGGGALRKR